MRAFVCGLLAAALIFPVASAVQVHMARSLPTNPPCVGFSLYPPDFSVGCFGIEIISSDGSLIVGSPSKCFALTIGTDPSLTEPCADITDAPSAPNVLP